MEMYRNCFRKYTHIRSSLIWGDVNAVKNPSISIVIPTYKRADLLEEALMSCLNQEKVDFNWEIIVVDNNPESNNETEQLIKRIHDRRILYYRHQINMGVEGNYNRGIELARSKWISFLHDDDLLMSDYLKKINKLLKKYDARKGKPLGYLRTKYVEFSSDEKINTYEELRKSKKVNIFQKLIRIDAWRFTKISSILLMDSPTGVPSCGSIMNKDAIEYAGGFDTCYGQCGDMYPGFFMLDKYQVYCMSEPIAYYRWRNNTSIQEENLYDLIRSQKQFMDYVYNTNVFSKVLGKFFGKSQYFCIVDNRKKNGMKFGTLLQKNKIDKIDKVEENPIRLNIYYLTLKWYRRACWLREKVTSIFN